MYDAMYEQTKARRRHDWFHRRRRRARRGGGSIAPLAVRFRSAAVAADRRRSCDGGDHERIHFRGLPVELPRRSRVAARMAFCYREAGRLGWRGPWREAGRHALTSLRERFMRDDATVIAAVRQDGGADATFDLYNQLSRCWPMPAAIRRSILTAIGAAVPSRSSPRCGAILPIRTAAFATTAPARRRFALIRTCT